MADAIYIDGFSNWSDVASNFDVSELEPDEVLIAEYDLSRAYEGSARVLYRRGDRFYLVEGSHCSCFGLEGQWEPTEYATAALIADCLERRYDVEAWKPVIARLRPAQ